MPRASTNSFSEDPNSASPRPQRIQRFQPLWKGKVTTEIPPNSTVLPSNSVGCCGCPLDSLFSPQMFRNQWGPGLFGSPGYCRVQKDHYMKQVEADLKASTLDGVAAICQISLTLIVTFLISATKYLVRGSLMGEEFVLAHSLRVLVHSRKEDMAAKTWSRCSCWIHSQDPEWVKEVESDYKVSRPTPSDSLLAVRLPNLPKYSHQLGPKRDNLYSNHNRGHKIFTATDEHLWES